MSEVYDSGPETAEHIATVRRFMEIVVKDLQKRMEDHDRTKLGPDEKPHFDRLTPLLKDCTYGSDQYKDYLKQLKPALDHHYAAYRHHPEHHKNGIQGMHLVDLIEMIVDWKAATLRHKDGDLEKSITGNAKRFGYGDEFIQLFRNTKEYLEGGGDGMGK